jgi:magnesium transporter
MIIAYLNKTSLTPTEINADNLALLSDAIWIDLLTPTPAEEKQVETYLNLDVPTRDEMREIELSSRLYKDDGNLFMTASMIAQSDSNDPKLDAVTFLLTPKQLITIRYIEPQAFQLFIAHLRKLDEAHCDPAILLIELLDATTDRLADILELVAHQLDEQSKTIFRPQVGDTAPKLDYREILLRIGANGELNTKARECLISFNRLTTFYGQSIGTKIDGEGQIRLTTLSKDINALSDHANFISTKVNFLLDATLGMVNIEQNNIIKIFSVAAVIFLPPTLIASMYGMNFHVMPELSWKWGYPFAISLMLISSWLPYTFFKRKKWL